MTNPTSNFGWQMPTSTDLVTDLPADFEVFGQAVDTSLADLKGGTTNQVLAKNSNTDMDFKWVTDATGMTNPMTTTGDTIYSSSGSTPARLGIGSTGQVLTVAGGVPTWAAASGGANYSLINSGGTTLSGSQTTISGITNAEYVQVLIQAAQCNSAGAEINVLINGDDTSKYDSVGANFLMYSSFNTGMFGNLNSIGDSRIRMGQFSNNTGSSFQGGVLINGGKSTGGKGFYNSGMGDASGSSNNGGFFMTGVYRGTAAISSITVRTQSGSFTAGKVYIYTSA